MAGRGPVPKDPEKRQRRNAEVAQTELLAKAVKPPKLADPRRLQPETVRWWKAWLSSEQAPILRAVDWETLQRLVPLVDSYWRDPKPATAAEIRQTEATLGGSPDARLRLRWKIIPAEESASNVSKIGRKDPRLEVVS